MGVIAEDRKLHTLVVLDFFIVEFRICVCITELCPRIIRTQTVATIAGRERLVRSFLPFSVPVKESTVA